MNSNQLFCIPPYRVEKLRLREEKEMTLLIETPLILFNSSLASFSIHWDEKEKRIVKKEEMIFLFPGLSCSFTTDKETEVFLLYLPEAPLLYFRYISNFFPNKSSKEELFYPLLMDRVIKSFITHLHLYMDDNIIQPSLLKIKSQELFYLLNHSYKATFLSSFFYPVLTKEHHFMALVLTFYKEVKTVEELSAKCNLSLSSFNKFFQKVFHTSPYKWMKQKKTLRVYKSIYESITPLKEVADMNGFSSLSQMNDYCKKNIGMTPGEIRKSRISPITMN